MPYTLSAPQGCEKNEKMTGWVRWALAVCAPLPIFRVRLGHLGSNRVETGEGAPIGVHATFFLEHTASVLAPYHDHASLLVNGSAY